MARYNAVISVAVEADTEAEAVRQIHAKMPFSDWTLDELWPGDIAALAEMIAFHRAGCGGKHAPLKGEAYA